MNVEKLSGFCPDGRTQLIELGEKSLLVFCVKHVQYTDGSEVIDSHWNHTGPGNQWGREFKTREECRADLARQLMRVRRTHGRLQKMRVAHYETIRRTNANPHELS